MQSIPTLSDISRDLRRNDYASAKTKCDSALETLKGLESVPILLARAEAIRSLPDSDLKMALKDVEDAISIDPQDPNSHLSLGQVYQAMSIRALNQGKAFCFNQSSSLTLGRLDSLSIGASKLLKSAESNRFNPIFLPKEILETILLPLNPSQKAKCLKISKDWRNHLTSQLTLWRSVKLNLMHSNVETLLKSSSFNFFAQMSRNTLTLVHLGFYSSVSSEVVEHCFTVLKESSQTLKSLRFFGETEDFTGLPGALSLASRCINLEELLYNVDESVEVPDWEHDSDDSFDSYAEREDDYLERVTKEREEEYLEEVLLTNWEMKCQPSTINLVCSKLCRMGLEEEKDFKMFAKARSINLEWPDDGGFTRSQLDKLLRISSQSIETLSIDQDLTPLKDDDEASGTDKTTTMDPIQLPKLKKIEIKTGYSYLESFRNEVPININAPNLSWEASQVRLPNLIINQGQELGMGSKKV